MSRPVRVTSISFPGAAAGENHRERAIDEACRLVDQAAKSRPDIICLPETFTGLGGLSEKEWFATAEPVPGPTSDALSARAKRHRCHIICPMLEKKRGDMYNSAVFIDRQGQVLGSYHKMVPTIGEVEMGIRPGSKATVFDLDFGRVGAAICFDLNFPLVADAIKRNRPEIVFFPSMYRGGLQLRIWAYRYQWFVMSATPGEQSALVNPLGRVLRESQLAWPFVTCDIDLDSRILHLDFNRPIMDKVKQKYGHAVDMDVASPEAVFLMTCRHPRKSVDDIIREFKLETYDRYLTRAVRVREAGLRRGKRGPTKRSAQRPG